MIEINNSLEDFVRAWLPNYVSTLRYYIDEEAETWPVVMEHQVKEWERNFAKEYFHEALTAFAEAVEQATKESCAENAEVMRCDKGSNMWFEVDKDSILSAPSLIKK